MFEVADASDGQCYQELKAGVDGGRGAAHWDGLLRGELPTLHVLQVDIGCREDEVVNQLLIKEEETLLRVLLLERKP